MEFEHAYFEVVVLHSCFYATAIPQEMFNIVA